MCGNMPSSQPVTNTTGNSRPLAVCSVIIVTTPAPCSGSSSASATSDTRSRNSASTPGVGHVLVVQVGPPSASALARSVLNSCATLTNSLRLSSRARSCGSLEDSSSARYPVRSSTASTSSPSSPSRRPRSSSSSSTNPAIAFSERVFSIGTLPSAAACSASLKLRAGVLRVDRDARLGPVADAAPRGVQDAPHADRVAGVVEHPQVGDDVADLPALVKANAANDFVRNAGPDEHLFQRARRVVGAVEHRDVVVGDVAAVGERVDLLGDEPRLVVLVVGDVADDELALAGVGPQPLLAASAVAGDDGVGRRQDVLRRAVVLLEQNRCGVGEVALEVLDVADGRAAERVDRLVGVADHAQLGRRDTVVGRRRACRRARAPARTARGWCPGTRRRGCAGTAAGSTGRSAETLAAQRLSRR